nr:phosphatidylinositol 4,5-bisphosphate 3-kinase catalytic subunit beta isoform-like [Nothobranchius furzeri]XP_054589772.1 phosphatidylinositol 4,5-bisphosphate 3-kinase catalytic subunit beta isoform-like [Nothobranchius furzeri]
MPPAMTDLLDIWASHSPLAGHALEKITVDFLLPTGIYIQMDVPRDATIQHIKLLLWKQAQNFPLFPSLGEMESHMFECVNQAAVHEELEDETRRLCDVRPFLPVLKLVTRNCGRAERLLDSKIGVLIGKGEAAPQCFLIYLFFYLTFIYPGKKVPLRFKTSFSRESCSKHHTNIQDTIYNLNLHENNLK